MSENSSKISFLLDSRVFSKNGISKCLYWYASDFQISINVKDKYFYDIVLVSNVDLTNKEIGAIKIKLNRDFIDYNLRDIVKEETSAIKELIIAKAFSNGEFDENPKGTVLDPIGIKKL